MKYKFKHLSIAVAVSISAVCSVHASTIYDESRDRNIPVEIAKPVNAKECSLKAKCPVAFISAGYGVSHHDYSFISKQLNAMGYLTVAIGHELANDPPLSVSGNLFETRSENWIRGANTLDFLQQKLAKQFNHYDFENLLLVGHSNGGDISAWLANESNDYIQTIITLDHRRVPLPRTNKVNVLSLRASDFPADNGVLPTASEQEKFGSCIVKIENAKHNDIADFGPKWLKDKIKLIINKYLSSGSCYPTK